MALAVRHTSRLSSPEEANRRPAPGRRLRVAVVVAGKPGTLGAPLLSWNTRGKGHGAKLDQPQGTGGWKRSVILLPPTSE